MNHDMTDWLEHTHQFYCYSTARAVETEIRVREFLIKSSFACHDGFFFFFFSREIFTVSFVLVAEVSDRKTCSCGSQARSPGLRERAVRGTRRSSVGKSAWRAPGAVLLNTPTRIPAQFFHCPLRM
jgi:hypothetical protein